MESGKLIAFRTKAGRVDAAPYLETLKERFPEMNDSEIIRYALKVAAA